jgi:Ca2+-binding RTX toxin-like protein
MTRKIYKKVMIVGRATMMRRTGVLFAATLLALVVFSGVALAATISCEADVLCLGTKQADTLNGSEGNDDMLGKGRGDTLNGFGGGDWLDGQGGPDKLFGGPGNDQLYGGPRNDELNGGEGLDRYNFGDGWGKDTISDSGPSESLDFVVFSNGQHLPVSDNLVIKLDPGAGPEVKNASATSTINWEGNLFNDDVYPGSGDDQLTGTASNNEIFAADYGGADTISTGAGNDYIDVSDGVGDDVVDCGETVNNTSDDDMVLADSGDQVATNCERKINS